MTQAQLQTLSWFILCTTAASLASEMALAAEPPIAMQVVQVGDVRYISGGKSRAEREELSARTEDFRLQVRFGSNAVISQKKPVSVELKRHGDKARPIQLTAAGPLLLLNMPSGVYTLTASPADAPAVESKFELRPGDIKSLDIELISANSVTPP
jgi:hypothetical protein